MLILKTLKDKLISLSTTTLVIVPGLLGFAIGLIMAVFFPYTTGTPVELLIGALIFFLWGLVGVIIIRRKELPIGIQYPGAFPVLTGLLITIPTWGLAILALIRVIRDILR